jgi:hypothetical protein
MATRRKRSKNTVQTAATALLLGACVLAAGSAQAQQQVTVKLAVFADSFHVADGQVDMSFDTTSFRIETSAKSTGLFGFFFPWTNMATTYGQVLDSSVGPVLYESDGTFISERREVRMGYKDAMLTLERAFPAPDQDDDFEAVPPHMLQGALDPLSASLQAALAVPADLSSCPSEPRLVFDGRRLLSVSLLNTDNAPPLADDRGLPIPWPTLKCALKTEEIAGRWKPKKSVTSGGVFASRDDAPQVSTHVFFARPDPELAPVPVRIERRGGWSVVAVMTELTHKDTSVAARAAK